MATSDPAPAPATQVPDWEVPTAESKHPKLSLHGPSSGAFTRFLDRRLPPHKKYLGLRRHYFLIALGAAILALLALVIGLAVSLTKRNGSSLFLPLPSDSQHFTGDLTYYGTGLGACGITSTDSDDIVAVSHYLFDAESTGSDPNANPLCGLMIRAQRVDARDNQLKSIDLKVVDRCVGCEPTDIDVSPSAFSQLADPNLGRVTVTWAWLEATPTPTA